MIQGVMTKKLKVIPDERGHLMEILRSDDELFDKFGQVYVTTAYPGVVKGWHYHKKQTDHFAVVKGGFFHPGRDKRILLGRTESASGQDTAAGAPRLQVHKLRRGHLCQRPHRGLQLRAAG